MKFILAIAKGKMHASTTRAAGEGARLGRPFENVKLPKKERSLHRWIMRLNRTRERIGL
jgi:hypothetical protein